MYFVYVTPSYSFLEIDLQMKATVWDKIDDSDFRHFMIAPANNPQDPIQFCDYSTNEIGFRYWYVALTLYEDQNIPTVTATFSYLIWQYYTNFSFLVPNQSDFDAVQTTANSYHERNWSSVSQCPPTYNTSACKQRWKAKIRVL